MSAFAEINRSMGEAPVGEDGTVTRSAEVTRTSNSCLCLFVCLCFALMFVFAVKYVGSFPVDDCCLDDQIEQLHTQLKCLIVSPEP